MICKDCIHEELCVYEDEATSECSDFKDKTQVVEVVRCKDCEHFDTTNCSVGCGWCDVWDIGRFEDGFCDKGKKVE